MSRYKINTIFDDQRLFALTVEKSKYVKKLEINESTKKIPIR